jgi:hypothetical protein
MLRFLRLSQVRKAESGGRELQRILSKFSFAEIVQNFFKDISIPTLRNGFVTRDKFRQMTGTGSEQA